MASRFSTLTGRCAWLGNSHRSTYGSLRSAACSSQSSVSINSTALICRDSTHYGPSSRQGTPSSCFDSRTASGSASPLRDISRSTRWQSCSGDPGASSISTLAKLANHGSATSPHQRAIASAHRSSDFSSSVNSREYARLAPDGVLSLSGPLRAGASSRSLSTRMPQCARKAGAKVNKCRCTNSTTCSFDLTQKVDFATLEPTALQTLG